MSGAALGLRPWLRGRRGLALALLAAALGWLVSGAGPALVVSADVGPPDAIVMLASHEWERLPAAAALARRYPDSLVLLTLPVVATPFNCQRCPDRPAWLAQEGVAPARIVQLPWRTRNTYDEAIAVERFSRQQPLRRLVVVTSPYHTRRALAVFRRVLAGVAVGVAPAIPSEARPSRWWWWHGYDRHYVLYEWAANAQYWVKYGATPFAGR